MERRDLLALLAAPALGARYPRIERASDYAGELIRITAGPQAKQIVAEHGGRQEELEVVCGRECVGIYATSYNDPTPVTFDIGGERYTLQQRQRPVVAGVLVKKHVTYTPELLGRIQRESRRKRQAYATHTLASWHQGFTLPLAGRGDPFGKLRRVQYRDAAGRLVREHGKVKEDLKAHEGADIPAPRGTPVLAALDGLVTLADKDYFFEGNMVILSHGRLSTTYLHLDRLAVRTGQYVARGTELGTVGAGGYGVTGPHLHWAAKYNGRVIDPHSLMILAR